MIYLGPSPDNPIDQGDIVDQCPLTFLTEYDMDLPGQGEIECVPTARLGSDSDVRPRAPKDFRSHGRHCS